MALDAYVKLVQKFAVDLLLSLRHINASEEIDRIVGRSWHGVREQLQCVLRKNYQNSDGTVVHDEQVRGYRVGGAEWSPPSAILSLVIHYSFAPLVSSPHTRLRCSFNRSTNPDTSCVAATI